MAQERENIVAAAESLFDAMRQADADGIRAAFAPEAILERVVGDGNLQQTRIDDFANAIAGHEKGQVDERVFNVAIQWFENLATIWAPFTLHIDGELKACGVNQITFANLTGEWKIIHLVDRHHVGDRAQFIEMIENR